MTITNEEFVSKLREIIVKEKQIKLLQEQRRIEEQALVVEYKVKECNQVRNALALKYADQAKAIQAEIAQLKESLGE